MHLLSTFRHGHCSDLKIIIDGKAFETHKFIWMASSKWFNEKIPGLKPDEPITLTRFPGGMENFSNIMDYVYKQQDLNLDLSLDNCVPLLLATQYLFLKDIKKHILNFLASTFTDNPSDGDALLKLGQLNKMSNELNSFAGKTVEALVTNLHTLLASVFIQVLDTFLQTSNINDEVVVLLRNSGTSFSDIVSATSGTDKYHSLLAKLFLYYSNAEESDETKDCLRAILRIMPEDQLRQNLTPDLAKKLALIATRSSLGTLIEVSLNNTDYNLNDKSAKDFVDYIESFDVEKPYVISVVLDILLSESKQPLSKRERIFRILAEFHKNIESHNKLYLLLEKLLGQIGTEARVKNDLCIEIMCLVDMKKLDAACLKLILESPSSPFAEFKDGRFSPFLQVAEAAIELCLQNLSKDTKETAGPSPKRRKYPLLNRGAQVNSSAGTTTLASQ